MHAILNVQLRPGELLKVAAVAGSGTSTALREYARAWPQPCLYLAFNKVVQDQEEQQTKFVRDGLLYVSVKTLDALAYEATQHLHNGVYGTRPFQRVNSSAKSKWWNSSLSRSSP